MSADALARTDALVSTRSRDLLNTLISTEGRTQTLISYHALISADTINNAIVDGFVHAFKDVIDHKCDLNFVICICSAFIIMYISSKRREQESKRWIHRLQPFHRVIDKEGNSYESMLHDLLDIYIDLMVLQKRGSKELPASESILIVKEKSNHIQ